MLRKSKEQWESGGTLYDLTILVRHDQKLDNEEDIDEFIKEQFGYLKDKLMLRLGYVMDDNKWVKDKDWEFINGEWIFVKINK